MVRSASIASMAALLCSLGLACAAKAPPGGNPSFPVITEQARAAIDEMRDHPKPLARPLVIVGGFMDPNVSPPLFKSHFAKVTGDPEHIVTVSIGLCGSFGECRRAVIKAVDEAFPSDDPVWTTEVDVVGASLGGLVARCAAAPSVDPECPRRLKVARLFSIASPHAGANMARKITLTQFHRDMRPGSVFLASLAAADGEATYELVPYVLYGDRYVGHEFAAPPGVNPWWLPAPAFPSPHAAAMMDCRILADISRRLRGETPFTVAPAATLPAPQLASRSAPSPSP